MLAVRVRGKLAEARSASRSLTPSDGFNGSTLRLINRLLAAPVAGPAPGAGHSLPPGLHR
jgi:hypothetical protein